MGRKIGLLGGIGPEATGIFYLRLIEMLQKRGMIKSNADFPQIIINSIPAPELVFSQTKEEDISPYVKGLIELDQNKPDFIVMVCNTIHAHHVELQSKVRAPIIDLKEEFARYVAKNKINSMLLLATPTTIRSNLFKIPGIKSYFPNEQELKVVSETIFNFNSGVEKDKQAARLEEIASKYSAGQGAEVVVLGCTEISLMLKSTKLRTLDTMDLLLEAVIDRLKS